MSNIVNQTNVINYISETKKIFINRNGQPVTQKFKLDYRTGDFYQFQIINSMNQVVSPNGYQYEMFVSFINNRKELILLAYQNNYQIQDGVVSFYLDTYTENWLNNIKNYNTEVQVTIVRKTSSITEVVLRDNALAEPRPYIEGQTPTIITVQTVYTGSPTVSGSFSAGSDNILVEEVNNFAFGNNLTNNSELQFTIGQWNETDATKLFVIGNGTAQIPKTVFSVDVDGNIACGNISGDVLYLGGEQFSLSGIDEKFAATSAWVNNTFETKVDATNAYNALENEITAVDNKFSSYATKQELPTKVSDLTNDLNYATTGYVQDAIDAATSGTGDLYETKVDANSKFNYLSGQISQTNDNIYQNYALKSEVPTRVSDLENDSDFATKTELNEKGSQILDVVGANYVTNNAFNSTVTDLSNNISNLNNTLTSNYALISSVPTAISDLPNDVGYITGVNLDPYALKTEIPTKVSELENDAGYITSSQIIPTRLSNKKTALIDRDVKEYNFRIHYQEDVEVFVNWQQTLSGVLYISPIQNFELEEGKQIEVQQFVKPVGEFNAVSGNGVQIADLPETFGSDKILVFKRFITNDNGVYKQFAKFEFEYSNEDVEQLIHEPLTFIALEDDTKISFDIVTGVSYDPALFNAAVQYAINEGEWVDYTFGDEITINQGEELSWKYLSGSVNNGNGAGVYIFRFFSSSGKFNIEGSVGSLMTNTSNQQLFRDLTGLVDASKLELSKVLSPYGYLSMFNGCTLLTGIPRLPATTLTEGCYQAMFRNCTALEYVPEDLLPATTLAYRCYVSMFHGCTSLKNVCNLPATTLANYCYGNMFQGCTSLTEVPSDLLPATTLVNACYQYLFNGCTSLRKAPKLPATTLAQQCYQYLFNGCSLLDEIQVDFTSWGTNNDQYCHGWVANVAVNGTFKKTTSLPVIRGNNNIPSGWLVENEDDLNFIAHGNVQIELVKYGNPDAIDLHYSTDGETFQVYNIGDVITLSAGQVLSMYNTTNNFSNNYVSSDTEGMYYFSMSGTGWVQAQGHIDALTNHTSGSYWKFTHLFQNCTRLFDVSKLKMQETIVYGCYYRMFVNCTNLLYVPEVLPAEDSKVNCYNSMFQGCTSLTEVPEDLIRLKTMNSSSCASMFNGCTSLKNVPRLIATTLGNRCYGGMFQGCTSLTEVPEDLLPATTLATNCYDGMFRECTSLRNAPKLPATTIGNTCYQNMFYNCRALTAAPELPATEMKSQCYYNMFINCTSLTAAPELPATTLAYGCYWNMFQGCSNLTVPPQLPVTTLTEKCYQNMFRACTSLTDGPHIAATGLVSACCQDMFNGCSNLSSISVDFQQWNDIDNATYNWVNGVAESGVFRKPASLNRIEGPSNIPANWEKIDNDGVTFICKDAPVEIALVQVGTPSAITMLYSVNGNDLEPYSVGSVVSLQPGQTLTFKGTTEYFSSNANGQLYQFTTTGNGYVDVEGKIAGLVNMKEQDAIFPDLFRNCTRIVDASKLDLTFTFTYQYTFYRMFQYCTSLTGIPKLPATTLNNYCYQSLFNGCTLLSSVPEDLLPATTLNNSCYQSMFGGCTSLTGIPKLPATTLAVGCYANIFNGCTAISTVPQDLLPATTVPGVAYSKMFSGCVNLTNLPKLPATRLAPRCYENMFMNNTSITTIPEDYLPATNLAQQCYYYMFQNCTSLTGLPSGLLPATELAQDCYHGMFYGCSNLTGPAPDLPATKLKTACYQYMFYSTKITSITLPAKLLISNCYNRMLNSCDLLSSITVSFTNWDEEEDCTLYWLSNTGAGTGKVFYAPSSLDTSVRDTSHVPQGWTINPASNRGESKKGRKSLPVDDETEEQIIEEKIPDYKDQERYTQFSDTNASRLTGKVLGPFEPQPIEEDGEEETPKMQLKK